MMTARSAHPDSGLIETGELMAMTARRMGASTTASHVVR
jgi:hypothetical protein